MKYNTAERQKLKAESKYKYSRKPKAQRLKQIQIHATLLFIIAVCLAGCTDNKTPVRHCLLPVGAGFIAAGVLTGHCIKRHA